MSNLELADRLKELYCAETEGKFFDLVTDNVQTIIAVLRDIARITAERDAARLMLIRMLVTNREQMAEIEAALTSTISVPSDDRSGASIIQSNSKPE